MKDDPQDVAESLDLDKIDDDVDPRVMRLGRVSPTIRRTAPWKSAPYHEPLEDRVGPTSHPRVPA